MNFKPANEKSRETQETQKGSSGSAIVSFSNNGPNNHPVIQINIPQNSTTVAGMWQQGDKFTK